MPENRAIRRRSAPRSSGPLSRAREAVQRLWSRTTHRPVDAVAILTATAASLIIVVNAIFLQSGAQPAPFFANPATVPQAAAIRPNVPADSVKPTAPPGPHNVFAERGLQPVAARRNDPIGDLIGSSVSSSLRIMAVQHVLSAFGYGQIRPSGVLDEPTSAAIERFESDHKLPATGRLSDRLLKELANMIGHPVE